MGFFDKFYILHIISHFIQNTRKNWRKEFSSLKHVNISLKYVNIKPVWFHADWRPPLFSCSFLSFQMWRNSPLLCVPRWFSYNLPTINHFSHNKIYRIISLFVCMFRIFHPTGEFFTHLEMLQLLARGYKFWPMISTHDHWAVRVL